MRRPRTGDVRPSTLATAAGIVAPVVFVATVAAAGAATPGYDQTTRFVSELGQTGAPASTLFTAGLTLSGLLLGAFAVGRRRDLPGGPAVAALVGVIAVGLVVMASSPCSTGCPIVIVDRQATAADALHNAAASADLVAISLAALLAAQVTTGQEAARHAAAGAATALLSTAFLAAVIAHHPTAIALTERAALAVALLWLATLPLTSWVRDGAAGRRMHTDGSGGPGDGAGPVKAPREGQEKGSTGRAVAARAART